MASRSTTNPNTPVHGRVKQHRTTDTVPRRALGTLTNTNAGHSQPKAQQRLPAQWTSSSVLRQPVPHVETESEVEREPSPTAVQEAAEATQQHGDERILRRRSVRFSAAPPEVEAISPRGAQHSTRAYRTGLRQRALASRLQRLAAGDTTGTRADVRLTAGIAFHRRAGVPGHVAQASPVLQTSTPMALQQTSTSIPLQQTPPAPTTASSTPVMPSEPPARPSRTVWDRRTQRRETAAAVAFGVTVAHLRARERRRETLTRLPPPFPETARPAAPPRLPTPRAHQPRRPRNPDGFNLTDMALLLLSGDDLRPEDSVMRDTILEVLGEGGVVDNELGEHGVAMYDEASGTMERAMDSARSSNRRAANTGAPTVTAPVRKPMPQRKTVTARNTQRNMIAALKTAAARKPAPAGPPTAHIAGTAAPTAAVAAAAPVTRLGPAGAAAMVERKPPLKQVACFLLDD